MTEQSCQHPEEHCDLHACQLKGKERNPEIDKMFEDPQYACTNCGVKVHNAANVCQPKAL